MKSSELRKKFLNEYGGFLLDEYGAVVKGTATFASLLTKPREDMWDLLKDIISKASDVDRLTAKSTSEVIHLLGKGKVSIDQAMKLMELLKVEQEIKELPRLMKQLEALTQQDSRTQGGIMLP